MSKYQQIIRCSKAAIQMENWKLDKIPSVRQLVVKQFSCSKDTVQLEPCWTTLPALPLLSLKVATMFQTEPNRHEDLPLKLEKDRNQAFEDFRPASMNLIDGELPQYNFSTKQAYSKYANPFKDY